MANNRFNKQATPKGYQVGGQVKNSKGTSTSTKGGKVRGDIKLGRALVEAFGSKKTINKMKSNIQDKNRVKKMGGGSLKAVPADKKGLKKLPTEVRNKMGFMKKGGKVNGK